MLKEASFYSHQHDKVNMLIKMKKTTEHLSPRIEAHITFSIVPGKNVPRVINVALRTRCHPQFTTFQLHISGQDVTYHLLHLERNRQESNHTSYCYHSKHRGGGGAPCTITRHSWGKVNNLM